MMKLSRATWLAVSLVATGIPALAQGRQIQPKDGDVVLIEDGARVKMIRRSNATVRTIFSPGQHWLVILVDSAMPGGRAPDGRVDTTYTFNDVTGDWPLGERWEGAAVVDDYSQVGEMGIVGVGLSTPAGVVQLLSPRGGNVFRDQAATLVLSYIGAGRGGARPGESFAQAEAEQVGVAMRNAAHMPPPGSSISMGVTGAAPGGIVVENATGGGFSRASGPYPPPSAPVRVGGNVATPRRIVDASPVMPDAARQAGIKGVVILEIVIAPDGSVRDAKVLRSIPLLDQAAIDTARQWRYEPTQLNGAPVPVIMTVTVNFQ
jgi:TonB family protein